MGKLASPLNGQAQLSVALTFHSAIDMSQGRGIQRPAIKWVNGPFEGVSGFRRESKQCTVNNSVAILRRSGYANVHYLGC